ncbi:MAG: hypothetical protein OFPI_16850 [Osedax symbiont Rs2]|nr:MAG: hypothetical protein OFPI_16850 [Osedax symbiont Rs2]
MTKKSLAILHKEQNKYCCKKISYRKLLNLIFIQWDFCSKASKY